MTTPVQTIPADKWIDGPWTANIVRSARKHNAIWSADVIGPEQQKIAAVHLYGDETTERHAKLIAAAPELYEALCLLVETHGGLGCSPAMQAASAALAKVHQP